jgi:hypothetical protein
MEYFQSIFRKVPHIISVIGTGKAGSNQDLAGSASATDFPDFLKSPGSNNRQSPTKSREK